MALWTASFCIALLLYVGGIFAALKNRLSGRRSFLEGILLTFVAAWVMYFPYEYQLEIKGDGILRVLESLLTALLRTFNVYTGNGYERIAEFDSGIFSSIYSILFLIISITFMVYVLGVIISLFDGPWQSLRYLIRKHQKAYIFPQCNAKTLAIASTIPDAKGVILFLTDETPNGAEKEQILKNNGIYLTKDLKQVLHDRKHCQNATEIFLFDSAEEKNITVLETIRTAVRQGFKKAVRVYVETSSGLPFEAFHGNMDHETGLIVNRVTTEKNFVYHNLLRNSFLENPVPDSGNGPRKVNVLLLGHSNAVHEMLKAVLTLGQMPGYALTVMLLDSLDEREKLRIMMPDVLDECHVDGDAEYRFLYCGNTDYVSPMVEDRIAETLPGFTFAFVDIGNDLDNINMALRLHAWKLRHPESCNAKIQARVISREISEHLNQDTAGAVACVGHMDELYSYSFITMNAIEKASRQIHELRQAAKAAADSSYVPQSWEGYCRNDYNRQSVYARTIGIKYKLDVIDWYYHGEWAFIGNDPEWQKYEHMRWNMYTRTNGFRSPDADLLQSGGHMSRTFRNAARVHPDLVPFEMLPAAERDKDSIQLNEDIIVAIRGM